MWSSSKSSSQGRALRRILKFVFASLVAIFLWVGFANSISVNAASAVWSGASILYNDRNFTPSGVADGKKPPQIPENSQIFVNVEGQKASIIYFPPETDLNEISKGSLRTYDFDTSTSTLTNPSQPSAIELPAQEAEAVSCNVGLGMGWILCPLTNTLATAMDHLFGIVTEFLKVEPLNITNTDNSLFRAWDAMRQIANVAFIIVFLVLIYSQLTSVGVNNYGIKKLLPSIIVGAILVNLSWIISAVAVDLSNIVGYALQDFFMSLRGELFTFTSKDDGQLTSWASLSQVILSGSTVAAAGILAGVSAISLTAVSLTAALWLLLPVLVGMILAVVVVIMIFAARQALIVVLIIIAPLAFIARILPNTESLYKKWQSTFVTMLIFFPAISLLFGGAQLAGSLIIQNATTLNIVILGLAVQVAPLALSPFVLRISGGFLGKIGSILNNQKRGVLDRTSDLAQKRAKFHQQRSLAGLDFKGRKIDPKKRTPFRNLARRMDDRNRRLEDSTGNYAKMNDARYKNSAKYQEVFQQAYEGEQALQTADSTLERDLKKRVQKDSRLFKADMDTRLASKQAELQNLRLDSAYESMAAGDTPRYQNLGLIASGSEEAARDLSLTAMAKNNSQRVQHTNLSDALLENRDTIDGLSLREYAGGADTQYGADSALASAVTIQAENDTKLANERTKLISHFNLNGEQRQALAMGQSLDSPVEDNRGFKYTFDAQTDDYLRSAASKIQFTKGSAENRLEIIKSSGIDEAGVKGVNYDIRTDIADLIAESGTPNVIAWLGGVSMDKITRGEITDQHDLQQLAFDHIKGGRFKTDQWFANDPISIQYAIDVINNATDFTKDPSELAEFYRGATSLQQKLATTSRNDNVTSRSSDSTLRKINNLTNLIFPSHS